MSFIFVEYKYNSKHLTKVHLTTFARCKKFSKFVFLSVLTGHKNYITSNTYKIHYQNDCHLYIFLIVTNYLSFYPAQEITKRLIRVQTWKKFQEHRCAAPPLDVFNKIPNFKGAESN